MAGLESVFSQNEKSCIASYNFSLPRKTLGIYRDKTMDGKLMYNIQNKDKLNFSF